MFQILIATSVLPLPPAPGILAPTSTSSDNSASKKFKQPKQYSSLLGDIMQQNTGQGPYSQTATDGNRH